MERNTMPPSKGRLLTAKNGMVSLCVKTRGFSGERWIRHFTTYGIEVGILAHSILLNPQLFQPYPPGQYLHVWVMPAALLRHPNRLTSEFRAEAKRQRMGTPLLDLACLIRDTYSNAEIVAMGLEKIIVAHEPVHDPENLPILLGVDSISGRGKELLRTFVDHPTELWTYRVGLAFLAPAGQ